MGRNEEGEKNKSRRKRRIDLGERCSRERMGEGLENEKGLRKKNKCKTETKRAKIKCLTEKERGRERKSEREMSLDPPATIANDDKA